MDKGSIFRNSNVGMSLLTANSLTLASALYSQVLERPCTEGLLINRASLLLLERAYKLAQEGKGSAMAASELDLLRYTQKGKAPSYGRSNPSRP